MKKTVDIGVLTRKLIEIEKQKRKIIKSEELPEGFLYFSDSHIVEGTGKFVYSDDLPEGITIGMKDKTIIVGTKKERTAATVRSS